MEFDKEIKEILNKLGFTDLQSRIYLTILKSGGLTVTKLARSLGINRTNLYNILERLKVLDLIHEESRITGKVLYAKSYKQLLALLDQEDNQLQSHKVSIKSLIPLFNSFASDKNISDQPKVMVFEGKAGLNNIIDEILNKDIKDKEILLFTNQEAIKGVFSRKRHDEFVKRRVNNKIKIKVLAVSNEEARKLKLLDKQNLRETKILPNSFNFNSEIYIYNGKVCMLDIKTDIIGVIIESQELCRIHTQFFNHLWEVLN